MRKLWIILLGFFSMLSGVACLAVSANGPWGFTLNGSWCWVPPFLRLSLLVGGGAALLFLGGYALWYRRQKKTRCPHCGAERLREWTICFNCGGELPPATHKKTTNL